MNGCDHLIHPGFGDLLFIAPGEIESETLHVREATKFSRGPIVIGFIVVDDGFIHEVIAKDGGALMTCTSDGSPEASLGGPSFFLRKLVIPGGNGFFIVSSETGEIQVKAGFLSQ